jgi:hypothetical protein
MADIEKQLAVIEKKLDRILESMEELKEYAGFDAVAADQVGGTSRKLDEIIELLKERQ